MINCLLECGYESISYWLLYWTTQGKPASLFLIFMILHGKNAGTIRALPFFKSCRTSVSPSLHKYVLTLSFLNWFALHLNHEDYNGFEDNHLSYIMLLHLQSINRHTFPSSWELYEKAEVQWLEQVDTASVAMYESVKVLWLQGQCSCKMPKLFAVQIWNSLLTT